MIKKSTISSKVWHVFYEYTIKVTAVCAFAYAASVMTMIGTCHLLSRTQVFGPTSMHNSLQNLSIWKRKPTMENGKLVTKNFLYTPNRYFVRFLKKGSYDFQILVKPRQTRMNMNSFQDHKYMTPCQTKVKQRPSQANLDQNL